MNSPCYPNSNRKQSQQNNSNRNCCKKKFDFQEKKENTLCSLNEVEYFLRNFKQVWNCIRLYRILR